MVDSLRQLGDKRSASALTAAVYVLIFLMLVPVLHAAFGLALDELVSNPFVGLGAVLGVPGAIMVGVGLVMMLLAVVQLWTQGKGFPISVLPPHKLVIGGIYQTSRHPIYFGASAVFLGAGLGFLFNVKWRGSLENAHYEAASIRWISIHPGRSNRPRMWWFPYTTLKRKIFRLVARKFY